MAWLIAGLWAWLSAAKMAVERLIAANVALAYRRKKKAGVPHSQGDIVLEAIGQRDEGEWTCVSCEGSVVGPRLMHHFHGSFLVTTGCP